MAEPVGRRIVVTGSSGSGKTTLAAALAARLGVRHVELDALYHLPAWQPRPPTAFRALVDEATPPEGGWVVDGGYRSVLGDLLWPRADTVVFLDLPRWRVLSQLLPRTLWRGLRRQELWNGNVEDLRNLLSRDPTVNVVLWSWTRYEQRRREAAALEADPRWPHLTFVRLRARREVRALLDAVARRTGS